MTQSTPTHSEFSLPKKGARVVVAMSGGVDSSVAAAWLNQQGYDVIGISLQLHDMAEKVENKFGTCCSLSDIQDARRVAEACDFPFYVTDMESEFEESVIDDFVQEYLNGRTPNPCVRCNEKVKFNKLMDWAMDLGADYLATGHYAQIRFNPEAERHELCRGADPMKDQSYFLFTMRSEDLSRTLFPVGGFKKDEVRELAQKLGLLGVAKKPDSQEICFVQGRTYKEFIESRVPKDFLRPGPIVTLNGSMVGEHTGLHQFTIGQRKGIGLPTKGTSDEPMFVVDMLKDQNTVVVGPETALLKNKAVVSNVHWILPPDFASSRSFEAKIRYRAPASPVEVVPLLDGKVQVSFSQPQRAITPGQSVVFYRGETVFGGGWIESAERIQVH
jgi:tRNA-uridine 2-sulfurtransferase